MTFLPPFVQAMLTDVERLTQQYPEIADDEDFRRDVLEGQTDLNQILSYFVRLNRQSRANEIAVQLMIEELEKKEAAHKNKRELTRAIIQKILERANVSRVSLPEATIYTQATPQKVVIVDEAKLPEHLVRVSYEPDKKAIKSELERGLEVPGATLSNGSQTIVIR